MLHEFVHWVKGWFRSPSVEMLMLRELEEARRDVLCYESQMDYMKRMVDYNYDRIERLDHYLANLRTVKSGANMGGSYE